jgi:cell division protein FtsB
VLILEIVVDGTGSVVSSNAAVNEEIKKLRKENQELKEQNNLLEFKFQVLLDLVVPLYIGSC